MASGFPSRRVPVALPAILLSLITVSIGCGGGSGGGTGGTPTPTPTPLASPTPTPTPTPATAAGVKLSVGSATVPTGGIFQYQLLLTEPKPIGNSSTRPAIPKGPTGPVRGVAVNDASGQAVGIAVINGTTISVSVDSPNASLGTDVDYPLLVLTMPVTGTSGTFTMSLDASSLFSDGSTQYTILENNPGMLTIGGSESITDVIPGGGALKPGDTFSVLGIGFDTSTKIQVNNDPGATWKFVSANQIDVTVGSPCVPDSVPCVPAPSLQLDGDRIRAIKASTNETAEYFSYDRTDDAPGTSKNSLVTLVHPMFSHQLFTVGSFPYTAGGTQFTGIALQNTSTVDATVQIDLLDSAGNALVTPDVELVPARTKLARDIAELFATVPANVATVKATVTTGPAVKMLGMLGDTSNSTVVPVVVK